MLSLIGTSTSKPSTSTTLATCRAPVTVPATLTVPPPVNVAMLAALNAYVRVLDHATNIAEIVAGEK